MHPNDVPLCRSAVSPELGFTALANIPAASYRACMLPISAAPLSREGQSLGALSDARLNAQLVTIPRQIASLSHHHQPPLSPARPLFCLCVYRPAPILFAKAAP